VFYRPDKSRMANRVKNHYEKPWTLRYEQASYATRFDFRSRRSTGTHPGTLPSPSGIVPTQPGGTPHRHSRGVLRREENGMIARRTARTVGGAFPGGRSLTSHCGDGRSQRFTTRSVLLPTVLPPLLSLQTIAVRLPAFLVSAINHEAAEQQTTIDDWLHQELIDFAGTVAHRIERAIPGFRRAYFFPGQE
jgi:hypothetical protein